MPRDPLRALNRKNTGIKHISLNLAAGLLITVAASLALTYLCMRLQPISIEDLWALVVKSNYETFKLNWIPLLLIMLFLYALFNNTAAACGLTGGAAVLFSIVNRNMIYMRQDPFKPMDILMGGEFLGIAKSIDHKLLAMAVLGAVGFIIFFVLCLIFIRNKRIHPAIHLLAAAVIGAVCIWYNNTAVASTSVYDALAMNGNIYNTTDNFESKGFIYSFLYTLNHSRVTAPPTYNDDKAAIAGRVAAFTPADLSRAGKPNIIMVLGEAYSDILLNPHINFAGYTDPMINFCRLREESIAGHIVVPGAGGGTSDTEFDIFTGLNSRHFRGTPYTYSLIAKPVSALPSLLTAVGYYNLALHPGYGWFYNRQNVYPDLGFDKFDDIKTYDAKDTKGGYVTETQTMGRIISEYEQHMRDAPDKPLFEFCVTIQNHGPYDNKYSGAQKDFDTDLKLPGGALNELTNYIYGMLDCDRELGVLADYLSKRPEPVVLVYFGDHLPSFPTDVYNALLPPTAAENSFEGLTRLYKAPFIIWQNQAAKDKTPLKKLNGGDDWVISSSFLGANLLHMLGFDGLSPFMDEVNSLSAQYPVILDNYALSADGSFINFSETPNRQIDLYRSWEYYWLFN